MREDRLAHFPGLTPQPRPGTPDGEQMVEDLSNAMWAADGSGTEAVERAMLRFMIRRGYWPLGTRLSITEEGETKVTFPGPAFML